MRHGLDVRIAAALWAGMATGLFVSGGCSPLVSAGRPWCLDGWLGTVSNSSVAAAARDGVPPVITVTDSPGGAAEESPAVAEESPAPESVLPAPAGEMAVADVLAYALQHHPALQLREQEIQLALARLTAAGLLPNPQLVLDAETELRDAHTTDLTGRLMFTVPTGPKRRLAHGRGPGRGPGQPSGPVPERRRRSWQRSPTPPSPYCAGRNGWSWNGTLVTWPCRPLKSAANSSRSVRYPIATRWRRRWR